PPAGAAPSAPGRGRAGATGAPGRRRTAPSSGHGRGTAQAGCPACWRGLGERSSWIRRARRLPAAVCGPGPETPGSRRPASPVRSGPRCARSLVPPHTVPLLVRLLLVQGVALRGPVRLGEGLPVCRRQVRAERAPVGVRVGPVDGGHGPAVQLTACESFESISDREGEFAVLRGLLGLHGVLVAE